MLSKTQKNIKKEYKSEGQAANVGLSVKGLNKNQHFFMELYVRELFDQSMRSLIIDQVPNGKYFSDRQIRNHLLVKIKAGQKVSLPKQDMQQIRNRVRNAARNKKIGQKVTHVIDNVFSLKRYMIKKKIKK